MTLWRRFLCFIGRHDYEWGGKWLIRARCIQSWSRLDSKLKCHYCEKTIGPQPGRSALDGF